MLTRVAFFRRLLCSVVVLSAPALAAARPDAGTDWPAARARGNGFCVAESSYEGLPMPVSDGTGSFPDAGLALTVPWNDSQNVGWSVSGGMLYSFFPSDQRDSRVHIVLNTGDLLPILNAGRANQFHSGVEGDADAGYSINIDGTAVEVNYLERSGPTCDQTSCGDNTTQADTNHWVLAGEASQPPFTSWNAALGLYLMAMHRPWGALALIWIATMRRRA